MGTSSSYSAPTGGGWTRAKNLMSRFAAAGGPTSNASGGGLSTSAVVGAYVGAHGGSKGASSSAIAGRRVAQALGGFLADVAAKGFEQAVRDRGLEKLLGLDSEAALAGIVDFLAGPGNVADEPVARAALIEVMEELWEEAAQNDVEKLTIDEKRLLDLLERYMESYVFERLLRELGDRLKKGAITANESARLEKQLREFITETIKFEFKDIDPLKLDWNGMQGKEFIESLFQDAYSLIA